jgi:glycosyltransferase involved in cell wall biosynthesis
VQEVFDCVTTCGPRGNGLTERVAKALKGRFNNERYFFGHDHGKRLCMGKIVFQCSQHKEITRRVFEGMACGKMVITDRLPEQTRMHELFVDGEDLVYYDDWKDAVDKINFYANNDAERIRIAQNGYSKVLKEHTQVQRVDALEKIIEEIV